MDTIFALSSGGLPAGVAVVRVSGPATAAVVGALAGQLPQARRAVLRTIRSADGEAIDRGLVTWFPGPASFTGEDCAEFAVHGGRAVVAALIAAIAAVPATRPAEAGEFTRRAFENGRIDLTAVEGLADLIAAETETQRRQALRLADGALARRAEGWRATLIDARAMLEAELDFADEDDVPDAAGATVVATSIRIRDDIAAVLATAPRGERIREGFEVALMGPPNAGKSSLLNALAGRPAAIVTDIPGTTRDPIEVRLDLGGAAVTLVDTAGLRDGAETIEAEGIRRARERGRTADLVLWLDEDGRAGPSDLGEDIEVIAIRTKCDRFGAEPCRPGRAEDFPGAISVVTGEGIEQLVAAIARQACDRVAGEPALVAHARQRHHLAEAVAALAPLDVAHDLAPEVVADMLRRAGDQLGRLTGRIDVEEVLGRIFSTFCIGK